MKFEVVIREDKEDGGYVVNCPALPGCNSQGETVEEAQTNIKEAIEAYLESLGMDKIPLPSNSTIATVEM